jgi:hypothetical protein
VTYALGDGTTPPADLPPPESRPVSYRAGKLYVGDEALGRCHDPTPGPFLAQGLEAVCQKYRIAPRRLLARRGRTFPLVAWVYRGTAPGGVAPVLVGDDGSFLGHVREHLPRQKKARPPAPAGTRWTHR